MVENKATNSDNIIKRDDYDPIKLPKDGTKAEKVIWSTDVLDKAVDGMNKGLPLKANPFIGKDTQLLKPDLVYKRTPEEVDDYIKCMKDPIYFASKCKIKTPTGMKECVLRDYQVRYINHLANNRFSILLSCRQAGKSVTTAIFCLWSVLFRTDRQALLLSKSGPAGVDLLSKIKDMYRYLPYYLKPGVIKWNLKEISFDNNSSISTEPFSPTAGLGKTINFLILDEFAWCPPNDVELFYNNIIPTVTTDTTANVCIISTQNGFNLFYKLYTAAEQGKNIYAPMKVNWWEVPNWDNINKCWVKRDEKWRQEMVGVLGSEEDFEYQYGTMFLTSDNCIVPRDVLSKLVENSCKFVNNEQDPQYQSLYNKFLYTKEGYKFDKDKYYVITIDLAEGTKKDYTVFSIFEIREDNTFEHVARWYSNEVSIENAALEFWLMYGQLFSADKAIVSIEWNTYGALFYTYIINLNDYDTNGEDNKNWRFNICTDGVDTTSIVQYTKQTQEDVIAGIGKNSKDIPGVRMSHANKVVACSLLKSMLIKGELVVTDSLLVNELQNFEDKNGNGSYAASYGHDDIAMSLVQLPLLKNTPRFQNLLEDKNEQKYVNQIDSNLYDGFNIFNYYNNNINNAMQFM